MNLLAGCLNDVCNAFVKMLTKAVTSSLLRFVGDRHQAVAGAKALVQLEERLKGGLFVRVMCKRTHTVRTKSLAHRTNKESAGGTTVQQQQHVQGAAGKLRLESAFGHPPGHTYQQNTPFTE